MRAWGTTIRVFAIVNVVFTIAGMYFLVETVHRRYVVGPNPTIAYYSEVFYARSIVNLLFLMGLLVGSVFLWRLRRRGLLICNLVFGGEVLYFCLDTAFVLFALSAGGKVGLIGRAMAATGGTGEMGTAAQIVTGYPVIALVVLNIAYRKLRAGSAARRSRKSKGKG